MIYSMHRPKHYRLNVSIIRNACKQQAVIKYMKIPSLVTISDSFIIIFSALLLCLPVYSPATAFGDIYRFVNIDGVEIFTDSPNHKGAQIVIKSNSAKTVKTKKRTADKSKPLQLNEVVDKTVLASINSSSESRTSDGLKLPLLFEGTITSVVGMRIDPIDGKWRQHNGIDIAVREGTPVRTVEAGKVVYSGLRSGYGYTVVIEHNNGMVTLYGHNSALMVTQGQFVDAGAVIALSGNTGRSTGPHLHFEAWQSGVNITSAFLPGNITRAPAVQLAANRTKSRFHKQVMADGSILFTNIP